MDPADAARSAAGPAWSATRRPAGVAPRLPVARRRRDRATAAAPSRWWSSAAAATAWAWWSTAWPASRRGDQAPPGLPGRRGGRGGRDDPGRRLGRADRWTSRRCAGRGAVRAVSAPVLGEAQLDALREIGNIGAGTAATALAQITGPSRGVPTVTLAGRAGRGPHGRRRARRGARRRVRPHALRDGRGRGPRRRGRPDGRLRWRGGRGRRVLGHGALRAPGGRQHPDRLIPQRPVPDHGLRLGADAARRRRGLRGGARRAWWRWRSRPRPRS